MNELGLDIQGAADYVGEVCAGLLKQYERGRKNLPSWDPATDTAVAQYVEAIGCWLRGNVEYATRCRTLLYLSLTKPLQLELRDPSVLWPRRPRGEAHQDCQAAFERPRWNREHRIRRVILVTQSVHQIQPYTLFVCIVTYSTAPRR